jgi:hypothetical protein
MQQELRRDQREMRVEAAVEALQRPDGSSVDTENSLT